MCAHMCKRRRNVSERSTGWCRKLLNIFDWVILLWVDVKYSRWGGTKVWVQLKWSSVAMSVVSQPPVATITLSSNGLGEVISARCYCDWAHLTVTECSNRCDDGIGPLLLWPSSTSHRKIYDINNKVSKILHRTNMYINEQNWKQINMENMILRSLVLILI
jgi:hypothetical protein